MPCYTTINSSTFPRGNTIESSDFDNGDDSPNSLCIWEITDDTPTGTISIIFDTMELEEQEACTDDYVKIIQGNIA